MEKKKKQKTPYAKFIAWLHARFFAWLKKDSHDVKTIYVMVVLVCIATLALAYVLFFPKDFSDDILEDLAEEIEEIQEQEDECDFRRKLDGVCVEQEEDQTGALVAVMIENHIQARPLSGLSKARVVYEAPVEGNITRLMAIYDVDTEVEKIGPVRSARPYYLDWLQEYGVPMYMHVGGSPEALERITQEEIFDMNEFFRGWYFWRSTDRYAPHNTYTSSKQWQNAYSEYGEAYNESQDDWEGWSFRTRESCGEEEYCVEQIDTDFLPPTYAPRWTFNSSTQQYERFEIGKPHLDRESGEHIAVDTLIVQRVDATILDNVGRLGVETIGDGDGVVFRNGYAIEAQWYKGSKDERTIWEDVDGHTIDFQAGKIWVAVVSQNAEVTYE